MENRLRVWDASIKAKDECIGQLQSRLKKAKNHHDSHRVVKREPGRVRPIIVKFVRRDDRTALLSTRRIQREARSRIFINEDLTPRRAMAAKLIRALIQSNKLRKAYVMSGAVMIETNDGQKLKITDIKQLTRYQ